MTRPATPLGRLGEKVASALSDDNEARARAVESAGRAFTNASLQPTGIGRRRSPVLWLAFAVLGAVAVVLVALQSRRAPLTFRVDGREGIAQSWLAAASKPMVLGFSDGTLFRVASESRARVLEIDANGAEIALESGSLHAQVVHTPHAAWRLIAGPYVVRVTGTRFDLAWAPATQELSLVVQEGSVAVSGPVIELERSVHAGQTLVAAVTQGRLQLIETQLTPAPAPAPAESAVGEPEAPSPSASAGEGAPALPSAGGSAAPREGVTAPLWRELASSGDLRGAFGAAEAQGFSGVCSSASPADLLMLGDAARLSGRPERAEEALLSLRRRFPRDPRRTAAAFALGKVAFDQRRNYAKAAHWFETSMREQPSGPLAREAAGRRLEALRNAGDLAGAQRAATDYLAAYPGGPHAAVARQIVRE